MAARPTAILIRVLLVAVLLAACVYYFIRYARPDAIVAKVRPGIATNAVIGSLVVAAEYAMELKSEVAGRVTESSLLLDRRVKSGETLLQLDTGDVDLQIERARSDLILAKRKLEIGSSTSSELTAAKELLAEGERQQKLGLLPETEVTRLRRNATAIQQRLDKEQAEGHHEVEGLENSLKVSERTRQKMTLTAPFEGIVAQVYARKGDLIQGGTPIARLISISRTVEGRLSEENISGVKVGQKAMVSLLPYGNKQYDAKVVQVLSTSDPTTQRYLIHLEVDSSQLPLEKLVPGITGEVSVILDERPSLTNIPRRAIFGDNVYVVKDGRVELRKIRKGFVSLTAVEVLEGLVEGDEVIVAELEQFKDGKSVRPVPTEDPRWR